MDQQTEALRELQRKFSTKEDSYDALKSAFLELLSKYCGHLENGQGSGVNTQQVRQGWMEKAGL